MEERNGKDSDPAVKHGNIIRLPSLNERQAMQQREADASRPVNAQRGNPPMITIPPMTLVLLGSIIAVQFILFFFVEGGARLDLYQKFGFVPGYYTGRLPFIWPAAIAPFTYMWLHGNWTHVLMNGLMLLAFGAGVERWVGPWRMLVLFISCGLCAAAAQCALTPFSTDPVIGASGGLSGLFAAILVMNHQVRVRSGMDSARMMPLVILWIVVMVGTGMAGIGGSGDTIAWAAHLGGFLGGFGALKLMRLY